MIDQLLHAKKINETQYEFYQLFHLNELGRKVLYRLMDGTYMDEPAEKEFSGVGFAFYDGRRALVREIRNAILFVEEELKKEGLNDGHSATH